MKGRKSSSYSLTCACAQACTLLFHARGLALSPYSSFFWLGKSRSNSTIHQTACIFARARAPTPRFELKALDPDLSSPVLSFVGHILYIYFSPPLFGPPQVPRVLRRLRSFSRVEYEPRPTGTSKRSLPSLPSVPLSILGHVRHLLR
jgi:hypothetical protein